MLTDSLSQTDFLNRFILNAPQFMWFLGAGASRSANMPTATDLLWDLKAKYYCREQNEDLASHDIDKSSVRAKIQSYLDSKGFPKPFSPEEYSFYFDLTFHKDEALQQKYLYEQLSPTKVTPNIGHRIFSALLDTKLTRVVFTSNFDEVIETAHSQTARRPLSAFSLDGSYAALDALNSEQFPLYAKIHGDFRYKNIKNLPASLITNDEQIKACFVASSARFGMIVSGYSGRDANVMKLFETALEIPNAFTHGIIWTVSSRKEVSHAVDALLQKANRIGVKANFLEVETFDALMVKIWRQLPNKTPELDQSVRSSRAQSVNIPLQAPGRKYPILRTNALPIVSAPSSCGKLTTQQPLTFPLVNDARKNAEGSILTFTTEVLFWGKSESVEKAFNNFGQTTISEYQIDDPNRTIRESTIMRGFFEEALANALCYQRPLLLRRSKQRSWYAVVAREAANQPLFNNLRSAAGFRGQPGPISGTVSKLTNVHWAEAVSIKLEEKAGGLWLLLRPDIWISPMSERENAISLLRSRKVNRWNAQSYRLLDAWIEILLGSVGGEKDVAVSMSAGDYPLTFKVSTRTGFSLQV